jgi:hypothetical protein
VLVITFICGLISYFAALPTLRAYRIIYALQVDEEWTAERLLMESRVINRKLGGDPIQPSSSEFGTVVLARSSFRSTQNFRDSVWRFSPGRRTVHFLVDGSHSNEGRQQLQSLDRQFGK